MKESFFRKGKCGIGVKICRPIYLVRFLKSGHICKGIELRSLVMKIIPDRLMWAVFRRRVVAKSVTGFYAHWDTYANASSLFLNITSFIRAPGCMMFI